MSKPSSDSTGSLFRKLADKARYSTALAVRQGDEALDRLPERAVEPQSIRQRIEAVLTAQIRRDLRAGDLGAAFTPASLLDEGRSFGVDLRDDREERQPIGGRREVLVEAVSDVRRWKPLRHSSKLAHVARGDADGLRRASYGCALEAKGNSQSGVKDCEIGDVRLDVERCQHAGTVGLGEKVARSSQRDITSFECGKGLRGSSDVPDQVSEGGSKLPAEQLDLVVSTVVALLGQFIAESRGDATHGKSMISPSNIHRFTIRSLANCGKICELPSMQSRECVQSEFERGMQKARRDPAGFPRTDRRSDPLA